AASGFGAVLEVRSETSLHAISVALAVVPEHDCFHRHHVRLAALAASRFGLRRGDLTRCGQWISHPAAMVGGCGRSPGVARQDAGQNCGKNPPTKKQTSFNY